MNLDMVLNGVAILLSYLIGISIWVIAIREMYREGQQRGQGQRRDLTQKREKVWQ